MTPEAEFLVDAAAVFRLTRLVMVDEAGAPIRRTIRAGAQLVAGETGADWSDRLIGCPWCAGLWIAIAASVARTRAPRTWAVASRTLALSAITGALDGRV